MQSITEAVEWVRVSVNDFFITQMKSKGRQMALPWLAKKHKYTRLNGLIFAVGIYNGGLPVEDGFGISS